MRVGSLFINAMSDGTFIAGPDYFGSSGVDGHQDLFDRHGQAWLPIGCFLIRSGDRYVLIDAGMGPTRTPDGMLVGGQLPVGLRAAGISTDDITDVVCTHLHMDHVGWLFDLEHRPVFPQATIWLGLGDWRHFIELENPPIQEFIRTGFRAHADDDRLRLIDRDTAVAPGITAIRTPGHTPGHLCIVVSSDGERALLLGDAITCPVQLDEPTWHSMGDVDPDLADRTRERLWRELEGEDITGVVPTSRSSRSDACSTGAASAGGRRSLALTLIIRVYSQNDSSVRKESSVSSAAVFRSYLDAFTSGDLDSAMKLVSDDFSFAGPILQSEGKDAFVEGSRTAHAMAAGYTMLRQFEDGDEVVSIYEFELGPPATPGKVLMTEWNTVRDGKLASGRLVFDTAQFAALRPQS